ncbi:MAG: hypothetical protein COB49_08395 [Alphaproteobacteria bacterium]|nr:MAG: hypothetical protein COB49_08395 [Alphaproteobacteria bacterium]
MFCLHLDTCRPFQTAAKPHLKGGIFRHIISGLERVIQHGRKIKIRDRKTLPHQIFPAHQMIIQDFKKRNKCLMRRTQTGGITHFLRQGLFMKNIIYRRFINAGRPENTPLYDLGFFTGVCGP